MEYRGPEIADLTDVRFLHAAFLESLSRDLGEHLRRELPASLRPAVAALSARQIERLADVPFLLLSLSESYDTYWNGLLHDRPVRDLFTPSHSAADPLAHPPIYVLRRGSGSEDLSRQNLSMNRE